MHARSLWYVMYVDEDGNEDTAMVIAPTKRLAVALMHPFEIIDVVEIEEAVDQGLVGVYDTSLDYLEDYDDD